MLERKMTWALTAALIAVTIAGAAIVTTAPASANACGATRRKTEVLSTSVFLELSIGDLEAAVSVSLIMVVAAVMVLIVARSWGARNLSI